MVTKKILIQYGTKFKWNYYENLKSRQLRKDFKHKVVCMIQTDD